MTQFKKGDQVEQIVTPIIGEVLGFQIDQETGDRLIGVTWACSEDGEHTKYFKESDLKLA